MQAATFRRLMVFGVCLLGVGALYLVPSVARAPEQIGSAPQGEETPSVARSSRAPGATGTPSPTATATITTTAFSEPRLSEPATETAPEPPTGNEGTNETAPRRVAPAPRPASTPFVARPVQDETPPSQVTALEFKATADQLRLVWAPGIDDVGVVRYRIWLDGYEVETTDETAATLDWFNDDSRQHVVQIRAVDAAGNQSVTPATLLVTRPTPVPAPSPEVESPTPSPSETRASESPSPSESATPDGGNG